MMNGHHLDNLIGTLKTEIPDFKRFYNQMTQLDLDVENPLKHFSRFLAATLSRANRGEDDEVKTHAHDTVRRSMIVVENSLIDSNHELDQIIEKDLFGHLYLVTRYWDELFSLAGLETKEIMNKVGVQKQVWLDMKREWKVEDE